MGWMMEILLTREQYFRIYDLLTINQIAKVVIIKEWVMITAKQAREIAELKKIGFEVHTYYKETQFVDIGLVIKW